MSSKWYYRNGKVVVGPVSSPDIRKLVHSGEITRQTRIRRADRKEWLQAEKVNGLFLPKESAPTKSNTEWFFRDAVGKTYGPVDRAQLDQWFEDGRIDEHCQVRQGNSSRWKGAKQVYLSLDKQFVSGQLLGMPAQIWHLSRDFFLGCMCGLEIQWPLTAPHLRRCVGKGHHQFSAHRDCTQCGELTVGMLCADVVHGLDEDFQEIHRIAITGRRLLKYVLVCSFVLVFVLSILMVLVRGWFSVLIPVTLAVGFAIAFCTARLVRTRIKRPTSRAESEKRPSEHLIDEVNRQYVEPFLRRNEAAFDTKPDDGGFCLVRLKSLERSTGVLITAKELHMLKQVLARQRRGLWTNYGEAQLVLNSLALKSDYAMFKHRIEQLEASGMPELTAYVSLVRRDELLLAFLQQLLADRGSVEPTRALLEELRRVRHELKLSGFARDLEQRRHGSVSVSMEMVDAMDPYNFELLLGMVYESQGYRVVETPKSGDQGADVLVSKGGEQTAIQAKLYTETVGNKAVQEAIAARSHFRCQAAAVITNNYFTKSAKELARTSDVELVSRDELSQILEEFNESPKDYVRLAELMEPKDAG